MALGMIRDAQRRLAELVDLPAMVPFHEALGRLLGRELPVPPAHVTLYVAGRDKGIGVATHAQLRQLCVRDVALRPD